MADSVIGLSAIQGTLGTRVLTTADFDDLVQRNQKRIFRLLMGLLHDEDAADTLTQECFLRVYKKRDSFRGESSVDTWLFRIAVNLARDYQRNRKQGFWKRLFAGSHETDTEEPAIDRVADRHSTAETQLLVREEVETVWRIVRHLSPGQREVFVMRFGHEMSLEEIASTLEVETGTVKSHLSRALATVRKKLEEHRRGTAIR
jgi:RNA polymerase sigma-70 factor, ECF subfamily